MSLSNAKIEIMDSPSANGTATFLGSIEFNVNHRQGAATGILVMTIVDVYSFVFILYYFSALLYGNYT